MLNFFPQKTHLLPPISLIYKPLIERFLTKAGQVQVILTLFFEILFHQEEEVNKQGDMLVESAFDEVSTNQTEDNQPKESFDDFFKSFSASIQKTFNAKSSE